MSTPSTSARGGAASPQIALSGAQRDELARRLKRAVRRARSRASGGEALCALTFRVGREVDPSAVPDRVA